MLYMEPNATINPNISHFLSIPPELRAIIYTYLLTTSSPIQINTIEQIPHKHRPALRPVQHSYLARCPTTTDSSLKHFPAACPLPPSGLALARTSKSLSNEVLPVVYGENEFEFRGAAALEAFLNQIGQENVRLLRSVALPFFPTLSLYSRGSGPHALALLEPARGLRRLEVDHISVRYAMGDAPLQSARCMREEILAHTLPVLRNVHSALAEEGRGHEALDVLRFVQCRCLRWGEKCFMGHCVTAFPPETTLEGFVDKELRRAERCKEISVVFAKDVARKLGIEVAVDALEVSKVECRVQPETLRVFEASMESSGLVKSNA